MYSITELEGAAVIFALEKFWPYLEGTKINIVTDHHSLYFLTMLLTEFDFEITYCSGQCNKDADCLNRYPGNRQIPEEESVENSVDRALMATLQEETLTGLVTIDLPKMLIAQETDKRLVELKAILQGLGQLPARERKTYFNGTESWAVVVPANLRVAITKLFYNEPVSGHWGIEATYYKMRSKYYFANMIKFITRYIADCPICKVFSRKIETIPPLKAIVSRQPFEIMGIDVIWPLPASHKKHYIIVAVDYLTKYAETRALRNATADATRRFFTDQILLTQGAPRQLISDRRTNFVSQLFKDWLGMSNIHATPTTAYHSQANGLCERTNGVLINILKRYTNEEQNDWSKWLAWATFAYNTSASRSTGFTPFELVYVRPPRLPLEPAPVWKTEEIGVKQYFDNHKKIWRRLRELARTTNAEAQDVYTYYHDQHITNSKFAIGNQVLLARSQPPKPGKSKKFETNYETGWKIVDMSDQ